MRPITFGFAHLLFASVAALAACGSGVDTTGGGASTSSSSTSASSSTSTSGGCGGGCLGPGDCYTSGDCNAGEYCRRTEDCNPQGTCAPVADACPGAQSPVCGCDGTSYASVCEAAMAGQSAHVSVTECTDPPAGKFPCGTGYCDLATEYCRQSKDGTIACQPVPTACASDPTCPCLAGKVDCSVCYPMKAGGALELACSS